MYRAPLIVLVLALACDKSSGTTAPCDAATNDSQKAPGATAFEAKIRDTAVSASKVERMKVRVDDAGAIVKQSVYHNDASVIPAEVSALAEKTFPGGKPLYYETEFYADLGLVHEVELETADGKQCEVSSKPDGTLVYTECRMDPSELPEPVRARAEATFAGGKILEAEQKKGPEVDEYTVEIEHEGREFYLRTAPDGTVLAKLLRVPAIIEIPLQ